MKCISNARPDFGRFGGVVGLGCVSVRGERWSSSVRGERNDRSCGRRGAGGAGERFTEGFDTLDLKEAKALLDELHA
jgi:hypothetical protein